MTVLSNGGERTAAILSFLEGEHFRFRRDPQASARETEIGIDNGWSIALEPPATPLLEGMVRDFQEFLARCMGVRLATTRSQDKRIVWKQVPGQSPAGIIPTQDPAAESFEIITKPSGVEIQSTTERGLLHATHYLERTMANRGGPFLETGSLRREPAFMPRISNGVFVPCHQTPASPGEFSDAYLSLMSHYGTNGIHFYLNLWEVFQSDLLPELNSPGFTAKTASLRALNERMLRHGIDLYFHINTPFLLESHEVFRAHPELRGAHAEIFLEECSGKPWHCLCSGSDRVHAAYAEAIRNLFRAVPLAAGAVMIIGGECFNHCFTRPAGVANGDTNCPHCEGKSASAEAARLVNTVHAAIKNVSGDKALYAWPYSAVIWSARDPAQLEWIDKLDPGVSVLSNFDTGDEDKSTGGGAYLFDYNIKCIGPSSTFARQAERLKSSGRPIYAKTESSTTPDAFFIPYLPLHMRWLARFRAMRSAKAAGYIGQWRFYGMNASLPEELFYHVNWEEAHSDEAALIIICQRDFGVTPAEADQIVRGWRLLSKAWEDFPYSAMTGGERDAYMRGPFFLGPAHPLIFNVQDRYDLPATFHTVRGDAAEFSTPEELLELEKKAKGRYVSDLLVTLPFGVERYLELLGKCRKQWAEGLALLRPILEAGGGRAQSELGICEILGGHLESLENAVRFYQARDQMQSLACDAAGFRERIRILQGILTAEIGNAKRMLPLVERDPRIGYGYCYGPVYDAGMIRAKIAQCERVRDSGLAALFPIHSFSCMAGITLNPMTKELRIGVLGAERRGQLALLAHQPENGVFLKAACTLDISRIRGMEEQYGPDFLLTEDYRELLARPDLDAVFVCTPDYLHEEHAIAALESGKHVYLEKPMTISIEGCDRILETAERLGLKLYVGHNMRFFPVMQKMKALIAEGRIGKVQAIWCRHFISYGGDAYFRDWHSERRFAHGLLLQKAAHDIDIIQWLAGSYVSRVVGMGKLSVYDKLPRRAESEKPCVDFDRSHWPPKSTSGFSPKIDVEDHSMLMMNMENGVQASYMQCHYTPDEVRNYTVIGTEGRIENHGDYSHDEHWASVHLWNRRTGYSEHGHEVFSIPPVAGEHGGADPQIVDDFIRFLRGGEVRGAHPIDARMAVAAGVQGTNSLRDGNKPMDIPPVGG